MKNIKTVFLLVAIILVSVFAVQNSMSVVIRFLIWKLHISQALIIVLTVVMGVLIGIGLSLIKNWKYSRDIKQANNEKQNAQVSVMSLEKENAELRLSINELEKKLEELQKSEHQEIFEK